MSKEPTHESALSNRQTCGHRGRRQGNQVGLLATRARAQHSVRARGDGELRANRWRPMPVVQVFYWQRAILQYCQLLIQGELSASGELSARLLKNPRRGHPHSRRLSAPARFLALRMIASTRAATGAPTASQSPSWLLTDASGSSSGTASDQTWMAWSMAASHAHHAWAGRNMSATYGCPVLGEARKLVGFLWVLKRHGLPQNKTHLEFNMALSQNWAAPK